MTEATNVAKNALNPTNASGLFTISISIALMLASKVWRLQ
jgi:hypothetical protein